MTTDQTIKVGDFVTICNGHGEKIAASSRVGRGRVTGIRSQYGESVVSINFFNGKNGTWPVWCVKKA